MKPFLLTVALLTSAALYSFAGPTPVAARANVADSIVIEDIINEIVTTQTDPTNGGITKITVYNSSYALVLAVEGCGTSQCQTDISSLGSGTYYVLVATDQEYEFGGYITK